MLNINLYPQVKCFFWEVKQVGQCRSELAVHDYFSADVWWWRWRCTNKLGSVGVNWLFYSIIIMSMFEVEYEDVPKCKIFFCEQCGCELAVHDYFSVDMWCGRWRCKNKLGSVGVNWLFYGHDAETGRACYWPTACWLPGILTHYFFQV